MWVDSEESRRLAHTVGTVDHGRLVCVLLSRALSVLLGVMWLMDFVDTIVHAITRKALSLHWTRTDQREAEHRQVEVTLHVMPANKAHLWPAG